MDRFSTKSEQALHLIRSRILSGEFLPGRKLRIQELTQEFRMSTTPIREALRLLQSDNLIEYKPHIGAVVKKISKEGINDVYSLRLLLEPFAISTISNLELEKKIQEIELIHLNLQQASMNGSVNTLADLNRRWHFALYGLSNSGQCVRFIDQLWDKFSWRTVWSTPNRGKISFDEHEKVMVCLRQKKISLAAEKMQEHIAGSGALMGLGVGKSLRLEKGRKSPKIPY